MASAREKLVQFLERHGISKTAAGEALGVTYAAVIGWLTGKTSPDSVHRRAIGIWTQGEVPAAEWEASSAEAERLAMVRPFEPPTTDSQETPA